VDTNGVYCLCEEWDQPLMWAHYSDAHRGYCLEFTISDEDWERFEVPLEMGYEPERPSLSTSEFLRHGKLGLPPQGFFDRTLLTKSKEWLYEKEWRMLRSSSEGGCGPHPSPRHLLTGMALGARMIPEDEQRLRAWVRERRRPVAWYRARPEPNSYGLRIEPID